MGIARALSATVTAAAVCGCALLAVSMARADPEPHRLADRTPLPTFTYSRTIPAYRVLTPALTPAVTSGRTSSSSAVSPTPASSSSAAPPSSSTAAANSSSSRAPSSSSATSSALHSAPATRTSSAATHTSAPVRHSSAPVPKPKPKPAPQSGVSLPLPNFYTGSATRVITVVASSTSSTTATVQAWNKAPGSGWLRYGHPHTAYIGSQGMTHSPSESKSATPIGSFTLTRAFGRYSNPGTPLSYFQTTPADWWISQSGPLYNTHQHCSSGCAFNQGSPNEHLYYETPYYNYAVVIDYNTRNAGPVRQGAGSAFFLHVSVGSPTAGCVAVPQDYLVTVMKWLSPSAHPRILIGAP